MLYDVGYWISFGTGLSLLMYSGVAIYTLYDIYKNATVKASEYLAIGITLLLFSVGSNTLYWQVFGQLVLYYDILTINTLRLSGFYGDLLFKGSGIVGAWFIVDALKMMKYK